MAKNSFLQVVCGLVVCALAAILPLDLHALPFNDDMVLTYKKRTGSIVRGSVEGTVAVGSLHKYRAESKADTENWSNPFKGDAASAQRGERLYKVNCSACHGVYKDSGREVGAVAAKSIIPAPDIAMEAYKGRSDGFFYGTIHFGGLAVMPPVGWKLSANETWDIVSYLRKVQGAN